jgi:integrase/recombinase XerD
MCGSDFVAWCDAGSSRLRFRRRVMRRWDGLVERYSADLQARGLADATISMRVRELVRFGTWLKARRPRPSLESVDADLIVKYIESRSAFHSRASVAHVVSSLRLMGEFLVREALWRTNPLRWMRGPKMDVRRHLPRRIGREQQQALWAAAEGRPQAQQRYQAICLLALLYGTGLRRGELERLDVSDWDKESSTLLIDGQKTGRERKVPVGDGVWRCVEAYLPHRHNKLEATGRLDEQALFLNARGERLEGAKVSLLIARLSKHAGIERVTLHQFRHSCASDLLEAGAMVPEVQAVLGHASIQSTVRYAAVADPQRAAAMALHPVNAFLRGPDGERRAS